MSNYEFSGKDEITLEPEENVIKNANVIVEESRNAEKQVFSIVYDATRKDLLMAELKRLECEVLVQPNSPTSITVRMSKAQLAAIKSLNCIDKVEIMRENVDLGDAVSFTNNIKSESNSNNNAVYSEVGEVDSTNEGVATMSYGGEGECGCNNSNDMQNAITLSLESWTSEYIGCPDAELWYEFTPNATAYYTIYTNGSLDTIGELYDAAGNFLDRNDDYGTELNFRLVHQLTKNQKYYIKVTTYRNNTGSFGIVVTGQVFVDSIVVAPANVTLEKGKTETLTATVSPTYATNQSLRWESSNTNVVTVNSSTRKITAVNGGSAIVSAYALDGSGKRDCCQVSVTVPVASVTMDTSTRVMHAGTAESFSAAVLPQNATDKRLLWTSSNTAVAEVDSVTGYVEAKAVGTTNITATARDGSGKQDICVLTVEPAIPVQSVTLCCDTYTIKVGQSTYFSYLIHPYDATNQTVTWCSSNTDVAVVNATTGQITAIAPGTTTISVSTNDGSFVDSCIVRVQSTDPFHHSNVEYVRIKKWRSVRTTNGKEYIECDMSTAATKSFIDNLTYFTVFFPDEDEITTFEINNTLINQLNNIESQYQSQNDKQGRPLCFHMGKEYVDGFVSEGKIAYASPEYYGIWAYNGNAICEINDRLSFAFAIASAAYSGFMYGFTKILSMQSTQLATGQNKTYNHSQYMDVVESQKAIADISDDVAVQLGKTDITSSSTTRRTWRSSEMRAVEDYSMSSGYEYNKSYKIIDGKITQVPHGTPGSQRPDLYNPMTNHIVEVKNYTITTQAGRNNLANNISAQYNNRRTMFPNADIEFKIDVYGQAYTQDMLNNIINSIEASTGNGCSISFMFD